MCKFYQQKSPGSYAGAYPINFQLKPSTYMKKHYFVFQM